MAVGALHLIATDTVTWFAYEGTYAAGAGNEIVSNGADLLLRFHAATLTTWIVSYWLFVPVLVTAALSLERKRPIWVPLIAALSAGCQVVTLVLFVSERQYTTAGETVSFRLGVTLLVGLIIVFSWELRRGAPLNQPVSTHP